MRTQHIQILNIQRAATARKIIVNLAIIVEQEHAFLGNLFAREIVRFHFHRGRELGHRCGADGRRCCGDEWGRGGPAEDAAEGGPD